ncbi:MAG: right-handed parallel beta-helix repeat-containing protein [Bacteroidota bacterium]|nr:right-handed parallel beta-helix repeat-containing protein [Bacteroidota bacterium]
MIKQISIVLAFVFLATVVHTQEKAIIAGMRISKTTKIRRGVYKIDAPADTAKSVVIIEGNDIVVDFNNAELKGSSKKINPDEFFGIAVVILNSKNVTIRNLKARGYKVALLAKNVERLTIDNCDLSYNYRQHLNSTQEKEDISDWMSYHHNEKDEWLRYGAALYLEDCNWAIIANCRVTGGQNALMMTRCNNGKIYNNDFSFNSGIGIGLYRCNNNEISYNKVIFNVRGYSHGVYNRGQDSAGILVYEQSSNNIFYKNNVTHGGDGFFLWAGQTTMDSGQGGCNDNMIRANDFSYAPTNGIEVTFSRNSIVDNRVFECDHGIWGGYSYETTISDNKFRNNNVDIAIEQGQRNNITYNISFKSKKAIQLWARNEQPADWGYAKMRDTRSRGYAIAFNSFNYCDIVFTLSHTDSLSIFSNTYNENKQLYKKDSTVTNLDLERNGELDKTLSSDTTASLLLVAKPNDPFKGTGKYAGRKNIRITEWGPYDFRSPVIWNTNPTDTSDIMQFDLLGPKGKWKIRSSRGVENISALNGEFPATITAQKKKADRTDIFIELEYTGAAITTPFGEGIAAGKPYKFSFKKFFQPINWEVEWFSFDTALVQHDALSKEQYVISENPRPFKTEKTNKLEYAWWGGIKADRQYLQFKTVAEGSAEFPDGLYELSVTWDDRVRVYVDGKLVIDEWDESKYNFDESPNKKVRLALGGTHHFKVEHMELGGFATLSLKIRKVE